MRVIRSTIQNFRSNYIIFLISFTIFLIDFKNFEYQFKKTFFYNDLNILLSLAHSVLIYFLLKKYIFKNISLEFNSLKKNIKLNFHNNKDKVYNFFIFIIFLITFAISLTYCFIIYSNNLFDLFYTPTVIINILNDDFKIFFTAFVYGISGILFYLILKNLQIGKISCLIITFILITSPIQLYYTISSPYRDYLKATFALLVIYFLIILFKKKTNYYLTRILIILINITLGIGMLIRQDFLVFVPLYLFLTVLLNDKKIFFNSYLIFFIFFLPKLYLIFFGNMGQWNLNFYLNSGFMLHFNDNLGIDKAGYDMGSIFKDYYILNVLYHDKLNFLNSIIFFPADFCIKLLANFKNILYLPYGKSLPPPGLDNLFVNYFYYARFVLLNTVSYFNEIIFLISIIILYFKKDCFFLIIIFITLLIYPVIQFQTRHFFYLEFLSLWSVAFLIEYLIIFIGKKNEQL